MSASAGSSVGVVQARALVGAVVDPLWVAASPVAALAAAAAALAVLAWPSPRQALLGRARAALLPTAPGWTRAPVPGGAGDRFAPGDVWRADPVELFRSWRLRRRPADLLDGALALLVGIGAGLDAGLTTARAVEVAAGTVVDPVVLSDALARGHGRGAGGGRRSGRAARTPDLPLAALCADLVRAGGQGAPGRPVSAVWSDWAVRCRSDELSFVAAAWRLSETTGAPLSDAVHRAAAGLRDDTRRRGRVAAAVAGPRATVAVLTLLPLAGPLLGLACGVDPVTLYLGSPFATASVVAGAGLAVLGRWWARRMVAGVTR